MVNTKKMRHTVLRLIYKCDKYKICRECINDYSEMIKNVNFLSKPSQLSYTSSLHEVNEHKYSKLYYHLTCE